MLGSRCAMSKMRPAMPTRGLPAATTVRGMPLTATLPTLWRRSSLRCCPPPLVTLIDDLRSGLRLDCTRPGRSKADPLGSDLSPMHDGGPDATMTTDHV